MRRGARLFAAGLLAAQAARAESPAVAAALHGAGMPVLLVDTFPGALDKARALGIPVMQAELLSEHGEEELEGRAADWVIAATPDDIYNGLICARLGPEIGRERVYQVAPAAGLNGRRGVSRDWRGKALGAPPLSEADLAAKHEAGWTFCAIRLEENVVSAGDVPLLYVRRSGALAIISAEDAVVPEAHPGDLAIVLAEGRRTRDDSAATAMAGSTYCLARAQPISTRASPHFARFRSRAWHVERHLVRTGHCAVNTTITLTGIQPGSARTTAATETLG